MFRKTTYLVINALNLDIKRFLQHEIIIKKTQCLYYNLMKDLAHLQSK